MPAFLIDHDRTLLNAVLVFIKGQKLEFQYPPKVPVDTKNGTWNETVIPGTGVEPLVIYGGSGPRTIRLEWTYIVGGTEGWDIKKIKRNVQLLRLYYTAVNVLENFVDKTWIANGNMNFDTQLICSAQIYDVGDRTGGTNNNNALFRLDNLNISHKGTIITLDDQHYPLRTDASVDLKFLTKTQTVDTGRKGDDDNIIYDISGNSNASIPMTWL